MGITCDAVPSLHAWAASLGGVDFPLASDFWPHGTVSRTYGLFDEEKGRPERVNLIVDESGVIRYIDHHKRSEVPDEEEIFEALKALPMKKS